MRLDLQGKDNIIFAGRVMAIAHQYETMVSLAKTLGVSHFTLRYRLGKARKLDEVKAILKRKKLDISEVIK